MRDKISVLLVDEHALVRKGFRRILEDDRAITVVGEARGTPSTRGRMRTHPAAVFSSGG